jgi:hypothetical protein
VTARVLHLAAVLLAVHLLGLRASAGDAPGSAEIARKLAAELETSYVLEGPARAMAEALRAKAGSSEWNALSGDALAEALTATCRGVIDDRHLRVRFDAPSASRKQDAFFMNPESARLEWMRRNFGFERAERLQGNVGYLDMREFVPTAHSRGAAAAAMAFLADTEALIVDLRKNGGGDPESVRFLSSYFFGEEPVLLNRLVNRELGTVDEYWTLKDLPGRRYGAKPIFVLTSEKTFSAAEEFAYNLQSLGRATIVGRTTGGGAHPVDRRTLGGGYSVTVPIARAENPVTKTNWEGVGVKPDVDVEAERALDRAWSLALETLAQGESDVERRKALVDLAAEKRAHAAR